MTDPDRSVTFGLATIPQRAQLLPALVERILPQCDRWHVYLNNHEAVPECLRTDDRIVVHRSQEHGDRGDAGKFFRVEEARGYFFSIDDDIVYPEDYAARLIRRIEKLRRRAVVGVHGARLGPFPMQDYNTGRRKVYRFWRRLRMERRVHVLGTGTVAFHRSTIRVRAADFAEPNMADIWFALLAQQQHVPLRCVRRPAGWMMEAEHEREHSIFYGRFNTTARQTELVNQWPDWRLW